jgi:hypothetical protein
MKQAQEPVAASLRGSIEYVERVPTASGREQSLHVYLPPSYHAEPGRRYPVLYMHFGQHLFEPKRAGGDSWQMHRLIDRLLADGLIAEFIVVGIDAMRATGHTDAYHYVNLFEASPCSGMEYEALILNELMPHVEGRFRVLQGAEHTAMIGACGGAAFTHNIAARHPGVFGKVGLLSPVTRSVGKRLWTLGYEGLDPKTLCWIDIGGAEGFFTPHARELVDMMLAGGARPGANLFYLLEPDGIHSDASWGARMLQPLLLFYGSPGRPVRLDLLGGDAVGVGGSPLAFNAILKYDSGFRMTLLDADYADYDPTLLRVGRDGRAYGLSEGTTTVQVRAHGFAASRTVRVAQSLPEQVLLTLRAWVANDRPELGRIYFNELQLERDIDGAYMGRFPLPRGYGLMDRFSCGMRKFELRQDGSPVPLRRIQADEDSTLEFAIERWPDMGPASAQGSAD